jgi:hypothetical protein
VKFENRRAGCSRVFKSSSACSGCRDGRKSSELWLLRTPWYVNPPRPSTGCTDSRSTQVPGNDVGGKVLLDPPTRCVIAASRRMGDYLEMLFVGDTLLCLSCTVIGGGGGGGDERHSLSPCQVGTQIWISFDSCSHPCASDQKPTVYLIYHASLTIATAACDHDSGGWKCKTRHHLREYGCVMAINRIWMRLVLIRLWSAASISREACCSNRMGSQSMESAGQPNRRRRVNKCVRHTQRIAVVSAENTAIYFNASIFAG